jgi:hypothetical protein
MSSIDSFTPIGDTVNVDAQGATALAATSLGLPAGWVGGVDLLIVNSTSTKIHVRWGASNMAVADQTKDIPVLGGQTIIFGAGPKTTHFSLVTETGSATGKLYITPGKGS